MLFFSISLQYLGRQFRRLSAQERHKHYPPCDNQIYCYRPLEPPGGLMRQGFNPTPGFQHTMPVFYAPAQAIPFPISMRTGLCNPTHHPLILCQLSSAKTTLPVVYRQEDSLLSPSKSTRELLRRWSSKISKKLVLNSFSGSASRSITLTLSNVE